LNELEDSLGEGFGAIEDTNDLDELFEERMMSAIQMELHLASLHNWTSPFYRQREPRRVWNIQ